jgi:hypothetical protein
MISNKPKIFISSTIFDFSDLRSSLKYYLENLGYEVLLSEYNDFQKDLNVNSYEACLSSIENCQYFILLVGSRVGGFFNEKSKISITQAEYRKAYKQLQKGKIKIINFVRENIWLSRAERKKLKNILIHEYKIKYDMKDEDIRHISNFKSDIANNAEFTFNFIDEIAKVKEMKKCQKDDTVELPIGNWVHPFKTFEDILNVLKIEFGFAKDIEEIGLKENLRYEIMENLKQFFIKIKSKILKKSSMAVTIANEYKEETKGDFIISKEQMGLFPHYLATGIGFSSKINIEFVNHALFSGKFLEYDSINSKLKQSPLSIALINLKRDISKLKDLESMDHLNTLKRIELLEQFNNDSDSFKINNLVLYTIVLISELQEKIVDLSYTIILEMYGDYNLLENYSYDNIIYGNKIKDKLEKEKITELDIITYLSEAVQKSK